MSWGDRWLSGEPPLTLTHRPDGGAIEQILRCSDCGTHLDARDVHYHRAQEGGS
ncbi:hypothetical protein ACFWCB_11010 [Streptomyces sp. NPDC060048]|uniref:hypothetical protein n=1 Tax=unclassified Streptomyces TaxID=2593676 RepID=UPI0036D0137E